MAKIELTRVIQNSTKGAVTYNEVLATVETNFIIAYMSKNISNIAFDDNVTTLYLAGGPLQFSGGPNSGRQFSFSEMDVKGTYSDIKALIEQSNTQQP